MAQDLQCPSGVDCSRRPAKTVTQGQRVRGEVPVGQLDMLQAGLIKGLSLEHLRRTFVKTHRTVQKMDAFYWVLIINSTKLV